MAPTEAPRLSPADFLTRLSSLFASTHAANTGSVFLTQKPLFSSSPAEPSPTSPDTPPKPPQILIRATDGKSPPPKSQRSGVAKGKKAAKSGAVGKVKFSTVVEQDELEGFFVKYAEVCKGGMSGLRKRERKKRAKKGKK
jgi:signal recognition particle subunit SRP14